MADCECLPHCVFFNDRMENMQTTAGLFKQRYCKEDNSNCAIYTVYKALGKAKVPPDMSPNMMERARQIISLRQVKNEQGKTYLSP
jgi:hypothetical protein